jgi:hypothetical protein
MHALGNLLIISLEWIFILCESYFVPKLDKFQKAGVWCS